MSNEVAILPPKEKAIDVYSKVGGLDPYLDQIRNQVDEFKKSPPKLDTVSGRAEYRSFAYKISRMKRSLEEMGKDLSAEAKALPKKIDAERKRSWDTLEDWQAEVLEPVIKYEQEQARIKAEKEAEEAAAEAQRLAEIAAKELQEQVYRDHELAIFMYADYLQKKEEARKQAIIDAENAARAQKEREEQIAKEAAENARIAAEKAAADERKRLADEQARKDAEAQAAIDKANREKLEAENARLLQEQQTKAAAEKAEADRIAAAKKAEDDKQAAIEAERKRQADAIEAERLANEKREKDRANVGNKRREAKETLMAECGLSEDAAKAIVLAIAGGKITNVSIKY